MGLRVGCGDVDGFGGFYCDRRLSPVDQISHEPLERWVRVVVVPDPDVPANVDRLALAEAVARDSRLPRIIVHIKVKVIQRLGTRQATASAQNVYLGLTT